MTKTRAAVCLGLGKPWQVEEIDISDPDPYEVEVEMESGALHALAVYAGPSAAGTFDYYAGLADSFPFEERTPAPGDASVGLVVRESVGVVGAIVPWNAPRFQDGELAGAEVRVPQLEYGWSDLPLTFSAR